MVDLGAGAAPWAIALLEVFPGAQAIVNDLPDVVPLTEAMLAEHGVLERARLLPGDYRRVPLAAEAFDVAVLGHVCRAEGEDGARALIARAADALRPGGTLVVADHFVDDAREASVNARLLGVTMMANTRHGATFTRREFREWLGSAGLVRVELLEPLPFTEVMLARKEGPT